MYISNHTCNLQVQFAAFFMHSKIASIPFPTYIKLHNVFRQSSKCAGMLKDVQISSNKSSSTIYRTDDGGVANFSFCAIKIMA